MSNAWNARLEAAERPRQLLVRPSQPAQHPTVQPHDPVAEKAKLERLQQEYSAARAAIVTQPARRTEETARVTDHWAGAERRAISRAEARQKDESSNDFRRGPVAGGELIPVSKLRVSASRKKDVASPAATTGAGTAAPPAKAKESDGAPDAEPPTTLLAWPRRGYVSKSTEEQLLPVLLRERDERGMMRDAPAWRVDELRSACARHGVEMAMALSLRRHHVRQRNRGVPESQLHLGSQAEILAAATLFEEAVARHLERAGATFLTETQQRGRHSEGQPRSPGGTPDFLLQEPLLVDAQKLAADGGLYRAERRVDPSDGCSYSRAEFEEWYWGRSPEAKWANARRCPVRPPPGPLALRWVEVKHFYGASTIPLDGRSAVGKLLTTVQKYLQHHGAGALVFCGGCGDALAAQLEALGPVLVLDEVPLDLASVRAQQSKWCGSADGEVLS